MSHRHRRQRRLLVPAGIGAVAVVALVAVLGTLVLRPSGDDPAPPRVSTTPLADVDLSRLTVARGSFCDALRRDDVERALSGSVTDATRYDSGQRATLAPGVRGVAHEFDCSFVAADGSAARAWVFAAPVSPTRAGSLARSARSAPRCEPLAGAPSYGVPDATLSCRTATQGSTGRSVRLRGLFGDAWLSCEVDSPASSGSLQRRAETWCAKVAIAAAGDRG